MQSYGPADGRARFFTQSPVRGEGMIPASFHQSAEKSKKMELRNGLLLTNDKKHITLLAYVFDAHRGLHIVAGGLKGTGCGDNSLGLAL